jgi:hypothetical protein
MKVSTKDTIVSFLIILLSGLLATVNVWVDKVQDIHITINDLYLIFLVAGWSFLFNGLYYKINSYKIIGTLVIIISFIVIRSQVLITPSQYLKEMQVYNSVDVFMSKRILEKKNVPENVRKIALDTINKNEEKLI